MIPQDTVNKILDAAQIVDVVSDFVTLKRRGANFVACCPFHNEKTPSFYVSPSKGIYKCFGCGKSGSAVGFVMEHESLTYVEALKYLARKYGIPVVEKEETAEDVAKRQRSESLLLVSEAAHKFFISSLWDTEEGRAVGYAYFRSRGLEDETIRKYGLGWAPKDRQAWLSEAMAKGYKEEYLVDTGLCIKYDDGHLADRFFDRVMFPVHSISGRVIAFGGRTLRSDKTVAKYVNSPETEIYDKSRSLYGIWFAKGEMSRADKCYLVEGYLDVLSMHQLGICNVVASSGTSLTVPQIRLIKKFTENVTIMYDGDSAGIKAAIRGIGLVLKEGLNVKVVLLPDGDDPDSFSRKHSRDEVREFVAANEKDFVVFKTEKLLGQAAGDPLKKAGLINDIADTIAQIPDAVKRSTYAEATAQQFGIEVSILFDRIARTRRKIQEDALKAAEREERRRRNDLPPSAWETVTAEPEPAPVQPAAPTVQEENRLLAPAERDLLYFLLRHGCDELDFESDSDYYSGSEQDKPSVAAFIRDAFSDGTRMANSAYAAVYEAYFALYDEGLGQQEIVKGLLDSADRRVADVASQLSTEKYRLTIQAFENAMTTKASWLVTQVPRAILGYAERRMQDRYETLRRELPEAESEQQETAILQEMVKIQAAQRRIKQRMGREKNTK